MKILLSFLFLLFIALIIVFLLGVLRTAQTQSQPQQKDFMRGTFPSPLPDGFQRGNAGVKTTWAGKIFDAKNHTGINVFEENGKQVQKYPFIFYEGISVIDGRKVLKLDYNVPSNPEYLHHVVDELVEIAPGKYLGKLNLRIRPFSFTLGFFTLSNP